MRKHLISLVVGLGVGAALAWGQGIIFNPVVVSGVTIRVSQVEIGWPSQLGWIYMVQARAAVTADWRDLGSVTNLDGAAFGAWRDTVPAGSAQQFYRVTATPVVQGPTR